MRWPAARGATLPVAAAALAFAALFFSQGSSQDRLFWIGSAAVIVAGLGWALTPGRVRIEGAVFFVALAAFVIWQGASIGWSIQAARSWDYTNRGVVYFAFAAVGALLGAVAPRRYAAVGAALLGALFAWALTAKVIPGIYDDYGRLARLRYPVGYWNELGLLAAVAVPLGLWLVSDRERDRRERTGGALLLYAGLVVAVLTYSRVGIVLTVAAALAWFALSPGRRLDAVGPLALAWVIGALVAGAALLLPGVSENGEPHRVRVEDGIAFGLLLVVAAVVLLLALRWVFSRTLNRQVVRGVSIALAALVVLALLAAVIRAGGPAGFVSDRWHEFSNPVSAQLADTPGRFTSASSSNRWRWWQESWDAFVDNPVGGTGAGTFGLTDRLERNSTLAVLEPHSAPLQDLTETGLVGFLLIAVALVAAVIGLLRRERSAPTMALLIGVGLCLLHILVDMDWDYVSVQGPLFMTVGWFVALPVRPQRPRWLTSAAIGVCALAALYSFASPWLASRRLDAAYDAVGNLDLAGARDEAKAAHGFNPLAVEPLWVWAATERGLTALDLYRQARDREPKNPETWYQLGVYELEIGMSRAAYRDLNRSYTLDRYGPAGVKGGPLDQARCEIDPATCPG
jgi:O-antigen ligase/polysaccharide polymerase Wzy-like membrane protein